MKVGVHELEYNVKVLTVFFACVGLQNVDDMNHLNVGSSRIQVALWTTCG